MGLQGYGKRSAFSNHAVNTRNWYYFALYPLVPLVYDGSHLLELNLDVQANKMTVNSPSISSN